MAGSHQTPTFCTQLFLLAALLLSAATSSPPFFICMPVKMGEPSRSICRGLAANFKIRVRMIYICPVTNGKGNVVFHSRA